MGTSTASAVQTATPPTVPGAPTLATPTTGSAQISLSWTAPSSNGGASITSYKIEQSTTSATAGFNVTYGTGSTATSNTITGLTNGQAYWFKVSAINSVGTSTASPAKAGPLFSFTHHTFTACDASGNLGPTSEQCSEAYKAESWNNKTFFNMGEYADQGKQYWTVPLTGIYSIEAMGADGGDGISSELRGGSGAKMSSRFQLEIGETLVILVGQKGYVRSGGGGTFVTTVNTSQSSHTEGDDVDYTSVPQGPEVLAVLAQINAELDNVVPNESFLKLWREVSLPVARVKDIEAHKLKASILIIAGGGGGAGSVASSNKQINGQQDTNGGDSIDSSGGQSGQGGPAGYEGSDEPQRDAQSSGGGGFIGDGGGGNWSGSYPIYVQGFRWGGGQSFKNGGKGGRATDNSDSIAGFGGFGGGGGINESSEFSCGGGGGGYSGGSGGTFNSNRYEAGGGGGSIINIYRGFGREPGVRDGRQVGDLGKERDGQVIIRYEGGY